MDWNLGQAYRQGEKREKEREIKRKEIGTLPFSQYS